MITVVDPGNKKPDIKIDDDTKESTADHTKSTKKRITYFIRN